MYYLISPHRILYKLSGAGITAGIATTWWLSNNNDENKNLNLTKNDIEWNDQSDETSDEDDLNKNTKIKENILKECGNVNNEWYKNGQLQIYYDNNNNEIEDKGINVKNEKGKSFWDYEECEKKYQT